MEVKQVFLLREQGTPTEVVQLLRFLPGVWTDRCFFFFLTLSLFLGQEKFTTFDCFLLMVFHFPMSYCIRDCGLCTILSNSKHTSKAKSPIPGQILMPR